MESPIEVGRSDTTRCGRSSPRIAWDEGRSLPAGRRFAHLRCCTAQVAANIWVSSVIYYKGRYHSDTRAGLQGPARRFSYPQALVLGLDAPGARQELGAAISLATSAATSATIQSLNSKPWTELVVPSTKTR